MQGLGTGANAVALGTAFVSVVATVVQFYTITVWWSVKSDLSAQQQQLSQQMQQQLSQQLAESTAQQQQLSQRLAESTDFAQQSQLLIEEVALGSMGFVAVITLVFILYMALRNPKPE